MLVVFYNVKTTQLDDGFCASIYDFYFESGQEENLTGLALNFFCIFS